MKTYHVTFVYPEGYEEIRHLEVTLVQRWEKFEQFIQAKSKAQLTRWVRKMYSETKGLRIIQMKD